MDVQRKKGILEVCVLAVLKKGPSYGYMIIRELEQCVEISESTLYPILKRLEQNGSLKTYREEYNGRMRKYYQLTQEGQYKIDQFLEEWDELQSMYQFVEEQNMMGAAADIPEENEDAAGGTDNCESVDAAGGTDNGESVYAAGGTDNDESVDAAGGTDNGESIYAAESTENGENPGTAGNMDGIKKPDAAELSGDTDRDTDREDDSPAYQTVNMDGINSNESDSDNEEGVEL